jgi:hypothetical protein
MSQKREAHGTKKHGSDALDQREDGSHHAETQHAGEHGLAPSMRIRQPAPRRSGQEERERIGRRQQSRCLETHGGEAAVPSRRSTRSGRRGSTMPYPTETVKTASTRATVPAGYAYLLICRGRATLATCMFDGFHNERQYRARTWAAGGLRQYEAAYRRGIRPPIHGAAVNRYLYRRAGTFGYRRLVERVCGAGDPRAWLRRHYAPRWWTPLVYPLARAQAVRLQSGPTAHQCREECDCTYCRCVREATGRDRENKKKAGAGD